MVDFARANRFNAFVRDDWPLMSVADQISYVQKALEGDNDTLAIAVLSSNFTEIRKTVLRQAQNLAFQDCEDGR